MGTERWYIAIPEGTELLERCKREPEFGWLLGHPGFFEGAGAGMLTGIGRLIPPSGEIEKEFCAMIRELNQACPGLKDRVFTLDRWYDKLLYLFSAKRRQEKWQADDWGMWAIQGASSLPKHLRGSQGHPIRYSNAEQVLEIALELAFVTPVSLRDYFDPQDMKAKTVYKFAADNAEEEWDIICRFFRDFKTFTIKVANHEEAMLYVVT